MGFFNQFGGSPVSGLLGSGIYHGLDMAGLDPSRIPDALANNAMVPQPEQQGSSPWRRIVGALGDGLSGFAYGASANPPPMPRPPRIDFTPTPPARSIEEIQRAAMGALGDRSRWAFTNKFGKGA